MATENQNFFKHFKDSFLIVFDITDVSEILDAYHASWYCAATATSTPLIQKNTDPAFDAGAGSAPTGVGDITIDNQTITVNLTQTDFTSAAPGGAGITAAGDYYHELTIGQAQDGDNSVVVASGIFTVKDALFNHR